MLLSLEGTGLLDAARTFLTIPDLFNFWLCGVKANEYSNASTTQLLDVRTRGWSHDLIHRLGLPARVFQPIVEPGTVLGPLRAEVAAELGLAPYPIVAPACHDTGSAVVAVPAETADYAYISSGTWSLVGIESRRPLTGPEALAANLTNEGGAFGTVRVLKNVMGLWLIQECRRAWARAGHELSYAEIMAAASRATPGAVVDPDDPSFFAPGDMLAAIRDYCVRTGQAPPEGVGPVARCVFDSLARRYREVIDQLEALNGRRLEVIHIVGGGSQNTLLCQLTANTCGRPVIAGPTEGTALGNALVQLMALGELGSLDDTRRVLRASIETQVYRPAG
jgi:rhamnulokinase